MALAAAAFASFGGACRQSAEPLKLTLSLAQSRIKPHDALWYVLEIKNVASKKIFIGDKFWHDQRELARNQEVKLGTFFEVLGPDGKELSADFDAVGWHGEFDFWANPPYNAPKFMDGGAWLEPGQRMTASASVAAAIRDRNLSDMRRGPPGNQKEWTKALKSEPLAKTFKDVPGWARPPGEKPNWVSSQARILTGFDFVAPGKYRIRAVYEPVKKEWIEKTGKMHGTLPEGTKVFRFESPWVEFEVVS
ncbi:hypothetical protein EPO15_06235 [bacterium]|nr:MAG: hypothetical protein EPO15_06235 [bacterium]